MDPPTYSFRERAPSPQQYHDLRAQAGLTPPPLAAVPKALAGSWHSVVAAPTAAPDSIVGMGRLVGDGSLFLQIVDIAVLPAHQGEGIGRRILEMLLAYADENAPDAYISLVGERPAYETFYPRFGFRDVAPSRGMFRMRRRRVADLDDAEGGGEGEDQGTG